MAELFTSEELAALVQQPVEAAPAAFLRDLLTGMVEEAASGVILADEAGIPSTVRAAALAAAARAYLNPQGFTSVTVDDFTYRREGAAAAVGLYLTADELSAIRAAYPGGNTASAFSVSPRYDSAPWSRTRPWPPSYPCVQP